MAWCSGNEAQEDCLSENSGFRHRFSEHRLIEMLFNKKKTNL